MSQEWVWQWSQTCSVCFSKLSSQTSIQLQLKSLIDRCFWLDTIWTIVTGSCVTSWSYIPSCYTRDGFYVWSYNEELSGSFWQLQGDTIGGPLFHEILSWGSCRNKSLDCTFSSMLCQTYGLRISGAAAQLKNSTKQFRAAETQPKWGDAVPQHPPCWMLCLLSRKTPVRSTVPVHLELIELFIYINPVFVAVLECSFALASYFSQLSLLCLPVFFSSFSDLWKWS